MTDSVLRSSTLCHSLPYIDYQNENKKPDFLQSLANPGTAIFATMRCKLILLFCFWIPFLSLPAQTKTKPIAIIFDSDMGPDYDDVGAITLLHAFADSGYV